MWPAPPTAAQDSAASWAAFQDDLLESSPLHYYLIKKDHDRVFELLGTTIDVDAIEPLTGTTPLTMAARDDTADAYDVIKALILTHGADMHVPELSGFKALHYAVIAGNFPVVEFLVDHGADVSDSPPLNPECVEDCERSKQTPLYLARVRDRPRIAEYLQSRGAVAASDDGGEIDRHATMRELLEVFRYRYVRPRDAENPDLWYRKLLDKRIAELAETLYAAGRVEEADNLDGHVEQLIAAILRVEFSPGMTFVEWRDAVLNTND